MDNYVVNMLKEWKLEELIERFRDEEVDEVAFKMLPDAIVQELIPKLGKRAIFMTKYALYKTNLMACEPLIPKVEEPVNKVVTGDPNSTNGNDEELEEPKLPCKKAELVVSKDETLNSLPASLEERGFSIAELSCTTDHDREAKGNLLEILKKNSTGAQLVGKDFFTRSDRELLSGVIVQHLLKENGQTMPQHTLLLWARVVEYLFPNEIAAIYCRKVSDNVLKGKFIDCLQHIQHDGNILKMVSV
ncbi:uncharacterized protein LOC128268315 [Anopheles cruzii]|uniref:uncharacterized protein LOC128268315 n=1 Tax=Anopheles cruzii TaxID=68878 RepID=UPI0022EC1885|nr:uncharacterized protein LOC128268315 [Anopheles cruzii]